MRVEEVKIYQFEELKNDAQEKAIDQYRDEMNQDFCLESDMITQEFEYELDSRGLPTDDIEWRLSYCQGDGVAFYGRIDEDGIKKIINNVDNADWFTNDEVELLEKIMDDGFSLTANIERNSFGFRYAHEGTMNLELDGDGIDTIIECHFDLDIYEDEKEAEEIRIMIEDLYESLEQLLQEEIRYVSKMLKRRGYDEIEYYNSDDTIKENILANEYEYTADGNRW